MYYFLQCQIVLKNFSLSTINPRSIDKPHLSAVQLWMEKPVFHIAEQSSHGLHSQLTNTLKLAITMCMCKQSRIWNIKSLLACRLCLDLHVFMAARQNAPCACERDSGGREGLCQLENRRRRVPVSAQRSDSWTYKLAACVHVRTHAHTKVPVDLYEHV